MKLLFALWLLAARPGSGDDDSASYRTFRFTPGVAHAETCRKLALEDEEAAFTPFSRNSCDDMASSRGRADSDHQVLSAMRHAFGGHEEKPS